ncbi:hypothetical protein CMV_020155 [Castanea mollissima]|uniref:Uncharacterized protein n=1 Tax=Castanea mollissima TaxID=60419 RepID=A0A8J4VM13_9ROSI|nr:hypothetical protein CMV_020155 [Castanea mollissima]
MEEYIRKRAGVILLVFLVMLILNACHCHASSAHAQVKGNYATLPSNDGLGECLISEDEWNPYERRVLYTSKVQSQNPSKPAVPCGGKLDSYGRCISAGCVKRSSYDRCRL